VILAAGTRLGNDDPPLPLASDGAIDPPSLTGTGSGAASDPLGESAC